MPPRDVRIHDATEVQSSPSIPGAPAGTPTAISVTSSVRPAAQVYKHPGAGANSAQGLGAGGWVMWCGG